jgi:hypothetical protein
MLTDPKLMDLATRHDRVVNLLGAGSNPQVDGTTYELGVWTKRTNGTVTVQNATPQTITGLEGPIAAPGGSQNYAFEAWIDFSSQAALVGGTAGYLYIGGSATVAGFRAFVHTTGNGQPNTYKTQDTFANNSSPAPVNFGMVSSTDYLTIIRGHLTCTGAGTINVAGATTSVPTNPGFITHIRCLLRCWPTNA